MLKINKKTPHKITSLPDPIPWTFIEINILLDRVKKQNCWYYLATIEIEIGIE